MSDYPTYESLPTWAKNLYRQTRKNAATRGIQFNLSPAEYTDLVDKCDDRCAVSGIWFDFEHKPVGRGGRRPFYPSVDRKDCAKGYEVGNVRMVCAAVNNALSVFGEDVLFSIARGVLGLMTDRERFRVTGNQPRQLIFNIRPRHSLRGTRFQAIGVKNGKRGVIGTFGTFDEAVEAQKKAAHSTSITLDSVAENSK